MRIHNVRLVDWKNDFQGALEIENGKITKIAEKLEQQNGDIDGKGLTLMPAFVDLHAHFRDPGQTQKEDITSGSQAAVKGGYTLVNLMANTTPIISTMEQVNAVHQKAEEAGLIDVHQVISITNGFDGKTIDHLNQVDAQKVLWLSDDGVGVMDSGTMLKALEKAKELGVGIMCHEEELPLAKFDHAFSEELMTFRDVELARRVGAKLHVCHVSTEAALRHVERGKKEQGGEYISCEVTPHHLYWTRTVDYKVNPPLREESDRLYLIDAIKCGTVDAIATDHAPHTPADKAKGMNGISGIEFAFSQSNTVLVESGEISLSYLSQLMSKNPADLLRANKGRLEVGYDGDVVLLDPTEEYVAHTEEMASRSHNTPIEGAHLKGKVKMTLHKGKVVYDANHGSSL